MKIYITQPGDHSVGIWDAHATIELPYTSVEDAIQWRDADRNTLRNELKTFFADNIFGDKCHVLFEDECPDCNAIREDTCPNEHCPTNIKEPDYA